MFNFKTAYNRDNFLSFLSKDFLPEDFNAKEENLSLDFASKYATTAVRLGKCSSLDLEVFEITHKSTHDARVGISRDAFQLLLRKSYCNRALVAFVPDGSKNYRFSLLQIEAEQNEQFSRITRNYSNPRRYSYFLGKDAHTKTPEQFLIEKGRIKPKDGDYFKDLLERFSVEVLTKQFYNELSNWYFWAIKNVSFPNDINDESDNERYNTENVIRLITRLIFTWFLKQKKLINPDLFDPDTLSGILKNFKPESEKQTNYYRAVLQNLFFATLNQEIGKRGFAEDKGFIENKGTNGIKNLYRFEKEFSGNTKQIMQLFSQVPFLNGGLFECLDDKKKDGKTFYWDGFSRNLKRQANIPNSLFFAKEQIVDISKEYNNKKMQAVKVSGIIEILNRYNFTVEENTPIEIEVALDPELLGKVFENLLGAFNPETQETARKQTGSFYTPREIVSYMVNESLIAYFKTNVPELSEATIRSLFSYEEQAVEIAESEREAMIQAAFNCKILDPACGSGAFPMGILQQMVHVLSKLDPCNTHWNKVVLAQAMKEFDNAEKQTNEEREELLAEIESTFDRSVNYPDYARKLHLIENCIYGVDIQSIAVQISKLRFFISLICEQKRNEDPTENFGIRPLPNLETKFVAANTLIGIEKAEDDMELFKDAHIKKLIDRLQYVRHRQFSVTNATKKKELRTRDEEIRHEIVNEVARLYKLHADEHLNKYKTQLLIAEKELEMLLRLPDDIRSTVNADLFGNETTNSYNYSENRRKELRANIKLSTDKIAAGSNYSRLNAVVRLAEQLTSWNPYDQNESSPFFDPEWMFGLSKENGHLKETTGYFDIVLGNPPYISAPSMVNNNPEGRQKIINSNRFTTLYQKWDLYIPFMELGLQFLVKNGIFTMIVPFPVSNQTYGKKLRELIVDKYNLIEIVDLNGTKVFENATVSNCIPIISKSRPSQSCFISQINEHKQIKRLFCQTLSDLVQDKNTAVWNLSIEQNDANRHTEINVLGDFCYISKGMVLNADENTAKGEFTKDDLISETYDAIHNRKYIDAKDIEKYRVKKIRYLEYNTVRCPNKLSRPTFRELYERPKLMFNRLGNLMVYLDLDTKFLHSDSMYSAVLWKDLKGVENKSISASVTRYSKHSRKEMESYSEKIEPSCLLGILNSKYASVLLSNLRGGDYHIYPEHLRNLPIPLVSGIQQQSIISLVEQILSIKAESSNTDTKILQQQLDHLVYKLYNLSYEEVMSIEPKFELSEVEYNSLQLR